MDTIQFRCGQGLCLTRRPPNLDPIDGASLTQSEVQTRLVLRAKAAAAGDFLHLLLAVPRHPHLRADGAAVALTALHLELDPPVVRRYRVPIQQQRPPFIATTASRTPRFS